MESVRHQCMIYEGSPVVHLPGLATVIVEKLKANCRCMYLNSPPMVAGMRSYLAASGFNVAAEVNSGALIFSSDDSHLIEGRFDVERMLAMLGAALDRALEDGYGGLWATGDMTWEFGREKNFTKLREYEQGLEALLTRRPQLQGICQYHADTMPVEALDAALCQHRAVYINETLSRMNPCFEPAESEARQTIPLERRKQMFAWASETLEDESQRRR
jgi:hypothetical protein